MRTKWCYDCRQHKRVERFDIDRHCGGDGRSAQCKACRRQRQNRGGYAACRNRALVELAARHPDQYQHHRQQARRELAPDTAPAQVWDQARGRALAELSTRHQTEWHQRYQQLRAAHPTWPSGRVFAVATNQQRPPPGVPEAAHRLRRRPPRRRQAGLQAHPPRPPPAPARPPPGVPHC